MEQHGIEPVVGWLAGIASAAFVAVFGFAWKRREGHRTLLIRIDERTGNMAKHLEGVSKRGNETRELLDAHLRSSRPHPFCAQCNERPENTPN